MSIRSDVPCLRCGGPGLHTGVCTDRQGEVYPSYAALAEAWQERGRPPLSAEEVLELDESVRLLAADEELPF